MTELALQLHETLGPTMFIVFSIVSMLVLCFFVIPLSTDWMVNNAAGLTGRYLGDRYRTLVINASTNNPEAANMIVAIVVLGSFGGWANPLGSLLANLYLMLILAPIFVLLKLKIQGRKDEFRQFTSLFRREWRLVLWHVLLTLGTYVCGQIALNLMMHRSIFRDPDNTPPEPATGVLMWTALGILIFGVIVWFIFDRLLHKQRPELFHGIDTSEHGESFMKLIVGTVVLIGAAWAINALFQAWAQIYESGLKQAFGAAVFTALHFFLGALVTSLPEVRVAFRYYQKNTGPDLHTALGSATYSNLTNLLLCVLGLVAFAIMAMCGHVLPWEK